MESELDQFDRQEARAIRKMSKMKTTNFWIQGELWQNVFIDSDRQRDVHNTILLELVPRLKPYQRKCRYRRRKK